MLINTSLKVGGVGLLQSAGSFRLGIPPFSILDMRSKAALHLPMNISLAKEQAMLVLALADLFLGSLCCKVLPSPLYQLFQVSIRPIS